MLQCIKLRRIHRRVRRNAVVVSQSRRRRLKLLDWDRFSRQVHVRRVSELLDRGGRIDDPFALSLLVADPQAGQQHVSVRLEASASDLRRNRVLHLLQRRGIEE